MEEYSAWETQEDGHFCFLHELSAVMSRRDVARDHCSKSEEME